MKEVWSNRGFVVVEVVSKEDERSDTKCDQMSIFFGCVSPFFIREHTMGFM